MSGAPSPLSDGDEHELDDFPQSAFPPPEPGPFDDPPTPWDMYPEYRMYAGLPMLDRWAYYYPETDE